MSTTFQLNADQFVKGALQFTGVLGLGRTPKQEWLEDARTMFGTILKTLQTRGVTLTQAVPLTLALQQGVSSYPLPADIFDVSDTATLQQVGASSSQETYTEPMVYSDYRIISDKTVTGPPTRFYVQKLAALTVFFWSVPDRSYTWFYQGIQLLPDITDGSTKPGLTQRWMGALQWRLAYWLSFPLNVQPGKRQELKEEADKQEAIALGQENEHRDLQIMLPPNPYGSYQ